MDKSIRGGYLTRDLILLKEFSNFIEIDFNEITKRFGNNFEIEIEINVEGWKARWVLLFFGN